MHFLLPGRQLKAAKVLDLAALMKFVPPIHQQYYLNIVDQHKDVVEAYQKAQKRKQSNSAKQKPRPGPLRV